jgi:radical SAM superfamily enzyme YgiQ (UPF0313 family)
MGAERSAEPLSSPDAVPCCFVRVTFVGLGQEQLAISLLSAVLTREGHETALAYHPALFDDRYFLDLPRLASLYDRTDDLIDEIVEGAPDLLAFSVLTPGYRWCLDVAEAVKRRIDVPVIFGGVHPSAVPEVCLENPQVDFVCVGEGEVALVRLCEELAAGHRRPRAPIENIWWREGGGIVSGPAAAFEQDLDSLPFWDKELWSPHVRIADNWLTMTSRGCPYRCTFCFNNFFAKLPGKGGGRYLRQRSVENVMQELVEAKDRWGIKRVDFEDDIFTTNKEWIRTFLGEYRREIDLPFQCLVHPRYIDDDLARWLKDAGCQHVQMGVQSADEEYKRKQLLRMEKDAHLQRSLESLQRAGLHTKLDHILGLPGEPLSAQERAREIYAEYPPRRIQTFWLTHLPGIELTRAALESGDLTPEEYDLVNRGETGRFHTRSTQSASDAMAYRRYEILFRLLPLLPRPLQKRLRLKHIPPMPGGAAQLVGVTLELGNTVKYRDAEAFNYARHYAMHLRRATPQMLRDLLRPSARKARRQRLDADRRFGIGSFGSPRAVPTPEGPKPATPHIEVPTVPADGGAEELLQIGRRPSA